ncbi:MAG TPA: hypothetical protein VHP30_09975 [Ignavibacteriales bacterium]|nr:hypothetical protein [Ignavibacteriales bacterium]
MKKYLLLLPALLIITAKLNAQSDERIYFNNGNWETGIVLELIPDSSLTFKKESGEVEVYRMRDVRRIIKRYHETLNKEIPDQTIDGAISINGSFSITKYEGAYYNTIINPSFNFFIAKNVCFGTIFSIESFSKPFSLDDALYKGGLALTVFFGSSPNKPFLGIEGMMQSEYHPMFEASVFGGYNYAISKNLAIQPAIKVGFLEIDKNNEFKYSRITIGIGLANYIF